MDKDSNQSVARVQQQDPVDPGVRSGSMGETRFPPEGKSWEGAPQGAAGDALREANRQVGEIAEYVSYYLSAKWDGVKLSLKNVGIFAVLGVVGLIAGAALVITAVVQVCSGIAQGLAVLFGGRLWLGNLVTGILLLGLVAAGAYFGLSSLMGKSRKATVNKYELRKKHERNRFGHDVEQQARKQQREQRTHGA